MPSFWPACPHSPDARLPSGEFAVSDDFLRSLWQRPEVAPVPESCAAERALHASLLERPRELPDAARIATLADGDAQDNFRMLTAFCTRLLNARSADEAWRSVFVGGSVDLPPLFIDLLTEYLLRHLLEGCEEGYPGALEVRAAETFFRTQKVTLQEGGVFLADEERVRHHGSGEAFGTLGKLLADARIKPRTMPLDVLTQDSAAHYWTRSGKHESVLPLHFGSDGLPAFCRLLERWVLQMQGLTVRVEPVKEIDGEWLWHVGLDAQATALLNALYRGESLDAESQRRLLCLMRLHLPDDARVRPEMRGKPVNLACVATPDFSLRIKPQNLLLNLPLL